MGAQRYGTARGTDTSALGEVIGALLTRACVGLPAAVSGLSAEAAAGLRERIDRVAVAVSFLGDDARTEWLAALTGVSTRADLPGLLGGRITRLLLDAAVVDAVEAGDRLSRALSHRPTVAERAAYAEGFLSGSALLLIHDRRILAVVDDWVRTLGEDDFVETLPVMRRAFGSYNLPERRSIAEQAAAIGSHPAAIVEGTRDVDLIGMHAVVATVHRLLGGAA